MSIQPLFSKDAIRLAEDLHRCFVAGRKLRFRPGCYGAFSAAQVLNSARAAWDFWERSNPHVLNNPHWRRACQFGRNS